MSWGWFDSSELSLTTSLQGKQGVQGAYALVHNQLRQSGNQLQVGHNQLRQRGNQLTSGP